MGRRLSFASARAAVAYDERVQKFVGAWKERGLRNLAHIAAQFVTATIAPPDADVITFVPADRDRRLERGHHPAERLARALGEDWQLPVAPLVRKLRSTPRQRGASLADRRRNVRGVFTAVASPRKVCLVDDVYTSGATANAAASALRKAGAKRVEVVTFARALRLR
jgi:predicted amidophosphoribosyltransferase